MSSDKWNKLDKFKATARDLKTDDDEACFKEWLMRIVEKNIKE